MPIFDNELINNVSDRSDDEIKLPQAPLGSPVTREINTDMGGNWESNFGGGRKVEMGLSLDELANVQAPDQRSFDKPFSSVSTKTLIDNKRYPMYERDTDLENIYGLQQSWYTKLGHSLVKTGVTAVGTFAQSMTDIPNTISAIKNGSMSDLAGDPNGYEGGIDSWIKNMEDVLPNYMTREEKAHPYLAMIPFAPGSANFWGESIIKNLGFTAGAIAGAAVQDIAIGAVTEGIGELPLIANQIGKAALWLNKIAGGTSKIETVLELAKGLGKTEQQLLKIQKLGNLAQAEKVLNGARYGIITWGAAQTEAGVEARDGYRHVKEQLIQQYKDNNFGEEPIGQPLQEIEDYSTNAMNTRFGINMALLTVSNAVQFDNLFKSFTTAQKGVTGSLTRGIGEAGKVGLKEGSLDTFERKAAEGIKDKVWDFVKPKLANVLAEGVYEEGGQYATERGTYDYYTRKYKNLSDPNNKKNWDDLKEITSSTTYGLSEQFNTTEGVNNMIVGGITALLIGGAQQIHDNKKGEGRDAHLTSAVNMLNRYGLTGILSNKYDNTLNSIGIAKEMQDAANSGNVFNYKNLKHDMFFNFIQSRIPSGMHDVTIEQLNMLKDLDKEDFQKTFGMDFTSSNKNTVASYVDSLITQANDIKKTSDAINNTFKNPFTNSVNPTTPEELKEVFNHDTFESWKTDLTYYSTIKNDVNERLDSIQEKVTNINPLISNESLSNITDRDSLSELSKSYEEQANILNKTITEYTTPADKKRIREQVKVLRTNSEKINIALNNGNLDLKTFNSLLNFELNNQDGTKDDVIGLENATELYNYGAGINQLNQHKKTASDIFDNLSTEEGFNKYFKQSEDIANEEVSLEDLIKGTAEPTFVNDEKQKEKLEVGREYEIRATKKASIKKLADDRYQVTGPDGTVSFYKTRKEAVEESKDLTDENTNLGKVRILALNDDGTVKIEDVNGDILNIDPKRLRGYKRLETDQEKLQKNKEDIDKQQKELEHNSGTTATSNSSTINPIKESRLLDAEILFLSSTSETEQEGNEANEPPHVRNSREFLNNAAAIPNRSKLRAILITSKQAEGLNLNGLVQISYGKEINYDVNSIEDVNNHASGWVGQVFVEQDVDGLFFVDKEGQRVGKVGDKGIDLNKIIFQTMRTTSLNYLIKDNQGNPIPRYRKEQKAEAEAYSRAWGEYRTTLFNAGATEFPTFQFSVSNGIPIEIVTVDGIKEKNHVGGILIDESLISNQANLIIIPTTGTIVNSKGEIQKTPSGVPVLRYGDNIQFLNNRTFNNREADGIYEVIRRLAATAIEQSSTKQKVILNSQFTKFLQNVLYWRSKSDTTTANQIGIDIESMTLKLGTKSFPLGEIAQHEQEIKDHLTEEAYNSINSKTIKDLQQAPFEEWYMNKEGKLVSIKWANYQTYLLSNKYPSGKARSIDDTPLSTSIAKPTPGRPYSFKQRYSTIAKPDNFNVQIITPAAEAKAAGVPMVGEYIVNGKHENTYPFDSGPALFTAKEDENGDFIVEVKRNDTTAKLAGDTATLDKIIGVLKAIDKFDASLPIGQEQTYVTDFMAFQISNALKAQKEAAATEQKTEEAPEQTTEETPAVTVKKRSGSNFRRLGVDGKERMSDAELELFKDWHQANVPNIPFEVLLNIITTHDGGKAWGVFEDGVAKFVKGGLRATEYHEIFEAIYKGMLSSEEQQALLDEFKAKSGTFKDRESGKKINYSDATDLQAKERIADDFSDFRKGKLPARSLGEAIRNFFSKIINFFKSFVSTPSLKEDLFDAIDTGKFKERTLSPESISPFAEYSRVADLTVQEANNFVQDMTARAAGILFREGDKGLLFNPERITGTEMFGKIEESYIEDGWRQLLSDETWSQLKEKVKDSLRTRGINFNEEDVQDINNEESNKNDYAPEPFTLDAKASSSSAIKFLCSTVIERQPTNQESAVTLDVPESKYSEMNIKGNDIEGYKLMNFSRVFATLLDKLSNTSSVSAFTTKLFNLAQDDANYVSIFDKIGGKDKVIPFSEFKANDWRLFVQFMQTFARQKPEALIQYKSADSVHTGAANLFTAITQTKKEWVNNIKTLAQGDGKIVKWDGPNRTYTIDQVALKAMPIRKPKAMIAMLNAIGVEFDYDTYIKLKPYEKVGDNSFAKQVESIYAYFGSNNDLMSISGKTLDVDGPLSRLAELYNKVNNPSQESTYFGVEGQRIGALAENNTPSVFENEFNEVMTIDELKQSRTELNDIYSVGSQVLKKGGLFYDKDGVKIKDFKVSYIQGETNEDTDKGTSTSKLTIGDRYTLEINQNLNGNYYIMIPADGSTEWMMNIGNNVLYDSIARGSYTEINSIFKGYLIDDINLALDYETREKLNNVTDNGENIGKAKELRSFKDILNEDDLAAINKMIQDGRTFKEIETYVDEHAASINTSVKDFIESTVVKTRSVLETNQKIVPQTNGYAYLDLDDNFIKAESNKAESLKKDSLSDKSVNDILRYANVNYIIANMEYHKIIFGDPYQFAVKKGGNLDAIKRFKSFLSPRRTTFDMPEYNTYLNNNLNTVAGVQLKEGDPGYHLHKSHTDTITIKDITTAGSLSAYNELFEETNEADAVSWLMDTTHREIKLKNGQWNLEGPEEKWFQWEMAFTRKNLPGYEYTSTALEAHDVKLMETSRPKYTTEILKPIVSGNKLNKNNFDLVLDKFSQVPIYYSMVKGTNLEKFYIQMMKQNIGYAIVESGRKVGAQELHSLYNGDGSFNNEAFSDASIVQVPWKAYGIQVETISSDNKSQTRGSQITKIASIDLFDNGIPTSPRAEEEYKRNTDILNRMHQNAYNELLNKLGVEDLGTSFVMRDGKNISETLMREMMRREVSTNTKETIKLTKDNQFMIPFEASPSYVQIRSILYSMIDKSIVSPKMSGGAHVQMPSTMLESMTKGRSIAMKNKEGVWEKITREKYATLNDTEKAGVMLTDDSLKFYVDKDGQRHCEMYLPHWFKDKFKNKFKTDEDLLAYLNKTEEGRSILTGVAFRIPTQALSSTEVFKVKDFLPQYMGATVVVPSEITTKSGSDFDIDKLNMYLKSVYADREGNIKLVKLLDTEEATKEFYGKVFDDTLGIKQMKKVDVLEALYIIVYGLDDPKGLVNRYGDYIKAKEEEYDNPYDFKDLIEKDLNKLTDENLQAELRSEYVKDMYKKALENEYYDSLEKLITLPENFNKLISPVDDAGLKKAAKELDGLRGIDDATVKNKLLDRNYMTARRNSFLMGKKWVGIVAVNITNLSLRQKIQSYIDPAKFSLLSEEDQIWLGDGTIALDHNTTKVNGVERISLGGTKVKNSDEFISNRLSGYATAVVDVAKDDFITRIIQSNLAIGTFMFLENIGVGEQSVFFMNQPIISEYLRIVNANNTSNLFSEENINLARSLFPSSGELIDSAEINVKNLKANISKHATSKLDMKENAEQHVILKEFLKYAKMAEFNFDFSQSTNYDTSRFGSGDMLARKQWQTEKANDVNIISSAKEILDSTFIGQQSELISASMQAMGAIFKLEQDHLRIITEDLIRVYGKNKYLSIDNFNKISNKAKMAFLDYIIQTKTTVNSKTQALLVDSKTSVANKLEVAKQNYPDLQILKDLQVVPSDRLNGAKSIELRANIKDAYDEDLYVGMMRELRDYNADTKILYKNLIAIAILQGSYQSSISIKNIIPIEDYSAIVAPIINSIQSDESLKAFSEGMFQRNNFDDTFIMPRVNPYFKSTTNDFVSVMLGTATYYSPSFPKIDGLNLQSIDRKVLLLTEKFNRKALNSDYVAVPRVVKLKSGIRIDVTNGQTVIGANYAIKKKKGDYSLNDIFGYKRVFLSTGEPLRIPDKNTGDMQSVYKLVNLYGDGTRATENYTDFRRSVIDNGTMQVKQELDDRDIVSFYGGEIVKEDVSLPVENIISIDETFDTIEDFTAERKEEILQNFADKHKMTTEEAKEYINKAIAENKEEVINKLKDCY